MKKKFSLLKECSHSFKGLLLDAYGVFWGGNRFGFFPGALEALESLVSQGKIVGVLSNTTQSAETEIQKLRERGMEEGRHFHFYLTAGSIAHTLLEQEALPFPTPRKKYWLLGTPHPRYSSHEEVFKGTPYQQTQALQEADFIYLLVPHLNGEDQTDPEVFIEELKKLKKPLLPMICSNPDKIAQEGNPIRFVVRQGTLASFYEKMGGAVVYMGKPSACAYLAAMECFKKWGVEVVEDVLMVGDTPETDIRGANEFGMKSALILKTGVMALKNPDDLQGKDVPDFLVESLA